VEHVEIKRNRWTVEKRVNLGDIFTMIGMMGTVLVFVGTGWLYLHNKNTEQDKLIAINENNITHMSEEIQDNHAQILHRMDKMETLIIRIDERAHSNGARIGNHSNMDRSDR